MKQLKLDLYKGTRGGRRSGAGRKRIRSKGVAHAVREKVTGRNALHVNFKLKASIRIKTCLKILKRAIRNARSHGLRVIHFSLQSNHVHLVLEAMDNKVLTRGMRSLTITFAKGIARGRIQLERYHLHVLKTIKETKNAVHYVLFNEQRHSGLKRAYVGDYSSLGIVRDLKELAKSTRMLIIPGRLQMANFLDSPSEWMLKQVLNKQVR